MTKDYAPSLTFTIYLDACLTTAVPPETAMSDLQKQLEDIKPQMAIVTNILPVVNELKEAYDSFYENQENPPTSQDDESIPEELLTNIVTDSPAAHSPPSPRSRTWGHITYRYTDQCPTPSWHRYPPTNCGGHKKWSGHNRRCSGLNYRDGADKRVGRRITCQTRRDHGLATRAVDLKSDNTTGRLMTIQE